MTVSSSSANSSGLYRFTELTPALRAAVKNEWAAANDKLKRYSVWPSIDGCAVLWEYYQDNGAWQYLDTGGNQQTFVPNPSAAANLKRKVFYKDRVPVFSIVYAYNSSNQLISENGYIGSYYGFYDIVFSSLYIPPALPSPSLSYGSDGYAYINANASDHVVNGVSESMIRFQPNIGGLVTFLGIFLSDQGTLPAGITDFQVDIYEDEILIQQEVGLEPYYDPSGNGNGHIYDYGIASENLVLKANSQYRLHVYRTGGGTFPVCVLSSPLDWVDSKALISGTWSNIGTLGFFVTLQSL